jgi:outer membrane protein assembly factor BamD
VRVSAVFLVLSLGLAGLAAGCGAAQSSATLTYGESARRDYDRALRAFNDHDCLTAEPLFNNIVREYSYSRYAALAELRAADCELQQTHYTEAIRRYRAFIRARPTHAEIDYANFQIAAAYFRQIPQDFFLSPPREERDQAPTRSALRILQRFLRDYPDSDQVAEATRMQSQILLLLARHELYVADFYLMRDRPRATIGRLERLLEDYEGSGLEPQALLLMGRTYLHMAERAHARRAFEELSEAYPDSGVAVQARAYLAMMGSPEMDAGEPSTTTDGGTGAEDEDELEDEDEDLSDEEIEEREEERRARERQQEEADLADMERREAAAAAAGAPPPPGGGSGGGSGVGMGSGSGGGGSGMPY